MKRILFVVICLLVVVAPVLASNGQGQTPLAVNVTGSAVCESDGTATVTLTFTATSGNASGGSLNWEFAGQSGTISINPGLVADGGDWTQAPSGPVKTYTTTVTLTGVKTGQYTATGEVHQIGGDYDNVTDTDSVFVESCQSENVCDKFAQLDGQVKGNKNLSKNGTPVNFVFKGAFGEVATLTVTAGTGTTVVLGPVSVDRNGESCVYNYQWIPLANGAYLPAGFYKAHVEGNGQQPLEFSFELTYQTKPSK